MMTAGDSYTGSPLMSSKGKTLKGKVLQHWGGCSTLLMTISQD
jgi:hypothetical protein